MSNSTKPKVAPPTDEQWKKAAARIALSYAPPMISCHDCGWPVIKGYCCTTCGSVNPSGD